MATGSFKSRRLGLPVALAALMWACAGGGGEGSTSQGATGGTTPAGATGGSTVVTTGGTWPGTGGAPTTGGWVAVGGGAATGGTPGTGGAPTGGIGVGGIPGSGGVEMGGSALGGSGGQPTGGTGVGGVIGSGGADTGGAPQGGSSGASTGGGGVGGSATGGQAGAGGDVATGGGGGSPLPPTTDYSAPGPFETTTDRNVGPDGQCTIFRPVNVGENGFLHAPIVFGPGIGMQATQLEALLLSFASHGFVVIGTGVLSGGPNDPGNRSAMENALNWILEQNANPGIYQGKLDVTHAVSMGYSVGGTAAVEIGAHEAVATTVSIHGHIASADLHGPMLQTSGTADTIGLPMQQQTYDASQVQTFLGTVQDADHGYIQRDTGGVERPAIIAWMRYWIYNDTGAMHYFWGEDCVLCTAPWTNPQRKNWQ